MVNNKLVLRAFQSSTSTSQKPDGFEFLPNEIFNGDIPKIFVDDFVQCLNVKTGAIEFRPLDAIWQSSRENWCIKRVTTNGTSTSQMTQGSSKSLIERKNSTGTQLARYLMALEEPHYLHMTRDSNNLVEIELPRYRISFFINTKGEMESRGLGATIDPNQDLGTFIGLQQRLVLRHVAEHTGNFKRSVLVPFGPPSLVGPANCVITLGNTRKVSYFRYQIDTHLQQLRAPANPLCRLFKAILHALTTGVLPDPLTGYTGTEEALNCLREQALQPSLAD